MARPVDSDSAETFDRILDAARAQLAAHGPSSFSLRRIAREAGVGLGTLHYYFGNRDGLLEACLESTYRGFEDGISASLARLAAGAPLEVEIAGFVRDYLASARERREEIRLRVLHTMERGALAPERLAGELVRMLDVVARALGGDAAHLRLRLAAHTLQLTVARYALHTDDEVRAITGVDDVSAAWKAIETHLTVMVQGLFHEALRPPAANGESRPNPVAQAAPVLGA